MAEERLQSRVGGARRISAIYLGCISVACLGASRRISAHLGASRRISHVSEELGASMPRLAAPLLLWRRRLQGGERLSKVDLRRGRVGHALVHRRDVVAAEDVPRRRRQQVPTPGMRRHCGKSWRAASTATTLQDDGVAEEGCMRRAPARDRPWRRREGARPLRVRAGGGASRCVRRRQKASQCARLVHLRRRHFSLMARACSKQTRASSYRAPSKWPMPS